MGGGARFTTRVIGDGRLDSVDAAVGGQLGARAGRRSDAGPLGPPRPDAPGARPAARGNAASASLEGPLSITSRTGPAASRYPSVWSPDYEGQLYAPPVGPVTLHENIVSLTFRPGREPGAPPPLVSAYPDGVAAWCGSRPRRCGGRGRRLSFRPDPDGGWTLLGTIGMERRTRGV